MQPIYTTPHRPQGLTWPMVFCCMSSLCLQSSPMPLHPEKLLFFWLDTQWNSKCFCLCFVLCRIASHSPNLNISNNFTALEMSKSQSILKKTTDVIIPKIHNMFLPNKIFCFSPYLLTVSLSKITFSLWRKKICSEIYTNTWQHGQAVSQQHNTFHL